MPSSWQGDDDSNTCGTNGFLVQSPFDLYAQLLLSGMREANKPLMDDEASPCCGHGGMKCDVYYDYGCSATAQERERGVRAAAVSTVRVPSRNDGKITHIHMHGRQTERMYHTREETIVLLVDCHEQQCGPSVNEPRLDSLAMCG
jgi:hypothetical protein